MRRLLAPTIGLLLIAIGINTAWPIAAVGVLWTLFWLAAVSNSRDNKRLAAAGPGSTRVETVKSRRVNLTIQRFVDAGWHLTGQSTSKSLLSAPRVTLTFEK